MSRRKKRDAPISYRPPERRRAELIERIDRSGLSTNAFITAAVFRESEPRSGRVAKLDHQLVGKLLSQAARIHDQLIGIRAQDMAGSEDALSAALQDLIEIRTCLMLALGKEP